MLKGIDPLLSPDLLRLLAEMGHDDALVLADANFIAMRPGAGTRVLRLPGVGLVRALQAVTSLLPLAEDIPHPVAYMQVGGTEPPYRSALQREAVALLAGLGLDSGQAEGVERFAFYERARKAYAIVVTGELQPWGNFILRKGVICASLRPSALCRCAAGFFLTHCRAPMAMPLADASAAGPALLRQRGSNHVGLRQFNERVGLQALPTHGSLAKAEIARVTGLTAQAIGLIAARLDDEQLLRREAPVRGRVGQPSVPIGLNPDGAFAVGIKIGRRSADWLLVDFSGQVRARIRLDYAFPDIDQLLPAIGRHLNQLLDGLGPL